MYVTSRTISKVRPSTTSVCDREEFARRLAADGADVLILQAAYGLDLLGCHLRHEGPRVGCEDPSGGRREELGDDDQAYHEHDAGDQHLDQGESSRASDLVVPLAELLSTIPLFRRTGYAPQAGRSDIGHTRHVVRP